ncbi:sulfatase [Verrucomicrobia bacterium]|nr:sulfatase [Verrucomicrobiota bacterium]MDC0218795.1 sulfatase [Verrucomicrobiota bacterium]
MRIFRIESLIVAAVWVLLCLPAAAADETKLGSNVIVMLVDDMGWTDLGCFGSDLYETPHIDRLAEQGMKFTDAYAACTVCSPTRAALMTGLSPARLHLTNWLPGTNSHGPFTVKDNWTKHLEGRYTTIAEAVNAGGYYTALIGKWHLAAHNAKHVDFDPLTHGFDANIGGGPSGMPRSFFHPYGGNRVAVAAMGPLPPGGKAGDYLTDRLTDETLTIIRAQQKSSFFIYLSYYNVHKPDHAKKDDVAYFEKKVRADMRHKNTAFAAKVKSVDDSVGRIVAELKKLGIEDRTTLMFTSDNGGQSSTVNVPLRSGKGSSYEGGVRVPLIVKGPAVKNPGTVSSEPVTTVDFYPTILELAKTKGEPQHNDKLEGRSLVPLLQDASVTLDRESIYWHYPHTHPGGAKPYAAIRSRDWKLIEFLDGRRAELYHLSQDIGEANDLAAKHPEKVAMLRASLHAWQKRVGAQVPVK